MQVPKLNFNENFNFQFKKDKDKFFIYDIVRKKWILLTPEEWVRQHWLHYLHQVEGFSISSIIVEKKVEINQVIRRLDILVTERTKPKILIECKAPEVAVNQSTFEQMARYNTILQAEKLILTNGFKHIFCTYKDGQYFFN